MTSKLASDPVIREAAARMLAVATKRVIGRAPIDEQLFGRAMLDLEVGIYNGVAFRIDDDIRAALSVIINRCDRLFGTKSNSKEIVDCAFSAISTIILKSSSCYSGNDAREIAVALEASLNTEYKYINNNHVIFFEPGVSELNIGPVRAVRSLSLSDQLRADNPSLWWTLTGPDRTGNARSIKEDISPICWEVTVRCAKGSVERQAEQLIALALSLLRLSLEKYPPLCPGTGEVETSNLSLEGLKNTSVILQGLVPQLGGQAPLGYRLNSSIVGITRSTEFIRKVGALFSPATNSVAERVGQGMVWMTRGRRALDRAERLLFFFTAIEAILAKTKSDPVSETIARYTSVMIETAPENRLTIFKLMKKLYSVRSEVIHSGTHHVSSSDADTVQALAETLYRRLLIAGALEKTQDDFMFELDVATHGSSWPLTS